MRYPIIRTLPSCLMRLRFAGFQPDAMMRWLTTLSLAVTFGMLALGGAILSDLRVSAWRQAEQAADNLNLALRRDIARNIKLYDLAIQNMMSGLAAPGLEQAEPLIRHKALFGAAATTEYLGSMLLVDAQGEVIANSLSTEPIAYSLATREHFLVHQQRPDVGLFISRPFPGKIAKGQIIVLTRRINNPDGSFGGIGLGALRIEYFHDLFDKLDVGPHGSVTLFRGDGRIIMRRPYRPQDIDRDLSKSTTFLKRLTSANGHFVDYGAADGVKRLFTVHQVDNLPLYLSVNFAIEDIFAEWWHKAVSIGAILTVLCVAAIALCLLFRRELKRRMAAEASLHEAATRLSVIAATDGLTGIANRRAFEDALAQEWRRSVRANTLMAILLLDVDCFKLFNDHYGHQKGDDVLRSIASCLAANIRRPADVVARYGGEEFIVLLPETDLQGALSVAETIRAAVAMLDIPHAHSPTGFATISIGVSFTYPTQGGEASALVKAADDALYHAKRSGRNRVASDADLRAPVVAVESLTLSGVY